MKKLESYLDRLERLDTLKYSNECALREVVKDLNKLKFSYTGRVSKKLYVENLRKNEKYTKLFEEYQDIVSNLRILNSEISDINSELRCVWYDLVFEDVAIEDLDL